MAHIAQVARRVRGVRTEVMRALERYPDETSGDQRADPVPDRIQRTPETSLSFTHCYFFLIYQVQPHASIMHAPWIPLCSTSYSSPYTADIDGGEIIV